MFRFLVIETLLFLKIGEFSLFRDDRLLDLSWILRGYKGT